MGKIRSLLLICGIIVIFNSCETDFDTIADWEDITVVYCLLNQKDSIHYLKVNKAFLGEGNALVYAQEQDSISYPYSLDAWIEEWTAEGDSLRVAFQFDTTSAFQKEPGMFYYPDQILYKGGPDNWYKIKYIIQPPNDTVGFEKIWFNEDHIFKLKIRNPNTGKIIWSETILVNDFRITEPSTSGQFIKFVENPLYPRTFEWKRAPNDEDGRFRYELNVEFNFREYKNNGDSLDRTLPLTSAVAYPSSGTDLISVSYWDYSFYSTCNSEIPYSDPAVEQTIVKRKSLNINTIVGVAAEEFNLYMQVYEPSTSIVQEKPPYTNVENGIGLFSSRYKNNTTKLLHPESIYDLDIDLKFR
ncbi:MAG: hypothetical protein R2764_08645 [Bacteroidales bacterium]